MTEMIVANIRSRNRQREIEVIPSPQVTVRKVVTCLMNQMTTKSKQDTIQVCQLKKRRIRMLGILESLFEISSANH